MLKSNRRGISILEAIVAIAVLTVGILVVLKILMSFALPVFSSTLCLGRRASISVKNRVT